MPQAVRQKHAVFSREIRNPTPCHVPVPSPSSSSLFCLQLPDKKTAKLKLSSNIAVYAE